MGISKGLAQGNLDNYRVILTERREELARNLKAATQEFLQEEAFLADSADQAAADSDRTLAMQMKNRESDIIRQIDEALTRIENGYFGICENCDEAISEARIRAFPLTTLCIGCKTELESQESRYNSRA